MEDVSTFSSRPSPGQQNKRHLEEEEVDNNIREANMQIVVHNPLPHGGSSTSRKKMKKTKKPPVLAYTVQCADCDKWRIMPTKKKYEQIRAVALEEPFTCSKAIMWDLRLSCDDPVEISPNVGGKPVWAVDKPGIPLPPPGWSREVAIRGQGGTGFADVIYKAPSNGKRLRSQPEVLDYLQENVECGLTEKHFSFAAPKPLDRNYCRKQSKASVTPAPKEPSSLN